MSDGSISSPEALYKFLRESKFKVLANIIFAGSPGHQIYELDYFLRKLRVGDIPAGKYLWVQRNGSLTQTMLDVFNGQFRQFNLGMICNDQFYEMTTRILQMAPEYGVDVGLSHLKNSVMSRAETFIARFADDIYYNMTNESVLRAHVDYFRLRSLTDDFEPWMAAAPPIDEELSALLGGKTDKLAVVHFRTGTGNAGTPVPAESLYPTLEYLRDNGYTVVKIGTEAYPQEFARFGVINYSESPLRNFRNDLALLMHAKIAVINGSGLENIADLVGVPFVSYARWHISLVTYSPKSVVVPTLLYDPQRKRLLSLAEQILFFKTRQEFWEGQFFGWHFPIDRYIARPPQADEMLSAVQEAISLGEAPRPLSPIQARFNKLDETGVLAYVKGRVSDFFLNRFQVLLDGASDAPAPVEAPKVVETAAPKAAAKPAVKAAVKPVKKVAAKPAAKKPASKPAKKPAAKTAKGK